VSGVLFVGSPECAAASPFSVDHTRRFRGSADPAGRVTTEALSARASEGRRRIDASAHRLKRLPDSSFQIPASSFQLPASSFPAPSFQLPASSFELRDYCNCDGLVSRFAFALSLPSGSWKLEARS